MFVRRVACAVLMVAALLAQTAPAAADPVLPDEPPAKTGAAAGRRVDRVGFFERDGGLWLLADVPPFYYGIAGDIPMLCDWDGDGRDTPGVFRPSNGFVHLRNHANHGLADVRFFYGESDDQVLCGDWDGDGVDSVGVYRPDGRVFLLRNSNTQGMADLQFAFGAGGVAVAGDWDGDGIDTVGIWQPDTGRLDLADPAGSPAFTGFYGGPGDEFVAGDWDLDGRDTPGAYRPAARTVLLANDLNRPEAERSIPTTVAGAMAVAGKWGDPVTPDPRTGDPVAPPLDGAPVPVPGSVALTIDGDRLEVNGMMAVLDSAWALPFKAADADLVLYLESRRRQGFNGIMISLVDPGGATTPQGDPVFAGEWFGSLSAGYVEHVASIVDQAAARNMVVGIAVAGAYDRPSLDRLDEDQARAFGAHLGSLFAGRANVFWILGGDVWNYSRTDLGVWDELAAGLREAGADQPITYHPWQATVPQRVLDAAWLDFVSIHSNDHRPVGVYDAVARYAGLGKPVIDLEPAYEDIDFPDGWHPSPRITADVVERQAADSLAAGAGGLAYGHASIAWWSTPADLGPMGQQVPWWDALDTPGVERLMGVVAAARG